ncbi:MAG: hypothetical protein KJ002_06290 [Candidatus Dadabacteria bacterium]|nr:hypothetical protein [Candidatus Dadabacteria bacterium]
MTKLRRFLFLILLGISAAGIYACPYNDGPAERAGERMDDAAEDVGDKMEDAAD